MNASDQLKVINAGFIIIRADDQPGIRIKFKGTGSHEWATLEKFESKAARDRRMKELLRNCAIVQD